MLVVSFAAYGAPEVVTELLAASDRGVHIDLVLEAPWRTVAASTAPPARSPPSGNFPTESPCGSGQPQVRPNKASVGRSGSRCACTPSCPKGLPRRASKGPMYRDRFPRNLLETAILHVLIGGLTSAR
jgi:hypothetical protein